MQSGAPISSTQIAGAGVQDASLSAHRIAYENHQHQRKPASKAILDEAMQHYRYHEDADATPTVDINNLSVPLMVSVRGANVAWLDHLVLRQCPLASATEGCARAYLGAFAVQQAQMSRGLAPIASKNDETKDLHQRRGTEALRLGGPIGDLAKQSRGRRLKRLTALPISKFNFAELAMAQSIIEDMATDNRDMFCTYDMERQQT